MIRDVFICLGKIYFVDLYVVDIVDSILFGLDFLLKYKCIVDFKDNILQLGSCIIIGIVKRIEDGNNIDIRKVFVQSRIVIFLNIVICVNVVLDGFSINKGMYVVFEFLKMNKKFVMVVIVIDLGNVVVVNIMNFINGIIVIKFGKYIGNVVDLGEELEMVGYFDLRSIVFVYNVIILDLENLDLLIYLCELYVRVCGNLNVEELVKVKIFFVRYKDVFVKYDLDLGCFFEIKYQINIGFVFLV